MDKNPHYDDEMKYGLGNLQGKQSAVSLLSSGGSLYNARCFHQQINSSVKTIVSELGNISRTQVMLGKVYGLGVYCSPEGFSCKPSETHLCSSAS